MEEKNTNVPVLALRGLTIFPNMLMHFDVERDISVKALEAAMENNQDILLDGPNERSQRRSQGRKIFTALERFPISVRFCGYLREISA